MCHSNLDIEPELHGQILGSQKCLSERFFTLSQGQQRIELPEGFGILIASSELVLLNAQVLNLNMTKGTKDVRHRVYDLVDELAPKANALGFVPSECLVDVRFRLAEDEEITSNRECAPSPRTSY